MTTPRLRSFAHLALLLAVFAGVFAGVAAPAAAQTPTDETPPQRELPWAVRLGMRVEQVNQAVTVLERVVLVPDGATYLDEIARWSPKQRWPVLFDEPRYAPKFIRAFKPRQVVRRKSIGDLPADAAERRTRIERTHLRALGGTPGRGTAADLFAQGNYEPPGIVLTSVDDPAWTAAIALAAGRILPLDYLDGDFGRPNQRLSNEVATRLRITVEQLVEQHGFDHESLGDAIETVTICRDLAGRYNSPDADGALAITDALCRHADGMVRPIERGHNIHLVKSPLAVFFARGQHGISIALL